MNGGGVAVEAVTAELASPDATLRETAWWIAGRHPAWAEAMVAPLRRRLFETGPSAADRDELARRIARFAGLAPIGDWLGRQLRDGSTPHEARRTILRALAQASPKETPPAWIAALTDILAGQDDALLGEAVAAARALRIPREGNEAFVSALLRIAANARIPAGVRLHALAAIPGGLGKMEPATLAFLLGQLEPEQPVANRTAAAEVLAHARLSSGQLETLAGRLGDAGPLELGRLLEAFGQSSDAGVGRRLVAALKASPARASLRVEALRPRLARFGPEVQGLAGPLFAAIEADTADQRARLEGLLAALKAKGGDLRRGHELFHSKKTACASCHMIAYVGGNVGPALTQIGRHRTEQDLLESVVFPNATLVQGYESVAVATTDGRVVNGVIVTNAPEAIVLATGPEQQVRLARDQIEEIRPSRVSVMPDGLAQQLTPQELADLMVFLKSCK
jgi:putative heme-binding domain-containing protein